jgi:hypothetical protein
LDCRAFLLPFAPLLVTDGRELSVFPHHFEDFFALPEDFCALGRFSL